MWFAAGRERRDYPVGECLWRFAHPSQVNEYTSHQSFVTRRTANGRIRAAISKTSTGDFIVEPPILGRTQAPGIADAEMRGMRPNLVSASPLCPGCWSRKFTWKQLNGRGRVNSWVVFHQAYFRSYERDIPYKVAEVELAEAPRVLATWSESQIAISAAACRSK